MEPLSWPVGVPCLHLEPHLTTSIFEYLGYSNELLELAQLASLQNSWLLFVVGGCGCGCGYRSDIAPAALIQWMR